MKYIKIPIHLIEFWYPESIILFIRTWQNLILFLEEDLAVGLMWRLLFTPLFHDSSILGRILSFLFRLGRILIGLFAFFISTLLLLAIAGYWLAIPLLSLLDLPVMISIPTRALFLAGLGLFLIHIFTHPHKKVWSTNDSWLASTLKKENLKFAVLLQSKEVLNLLANLELQLNLIPNWEIKDTEIVAKNAFELAKICGSEYINPGHFFVAAVEQIPDIDNLLLKFDLKITDFEEALKYLETKKQNWRVVNIWDEDFAVHHLKGVNRGWLGVPTPFLDSVGLDLTRQAARVGFSDFMRSSGVVKEVINNLSGDTGRNIIIVGPPGSGKSALVRDLAKQIVTGDAPSVLATKRLMLLDLTRLVSGMKTEGELAERVKTIFEEVEYAKNIIIAIEEIQELGMGEAGSSLNIYSLIQPYIESSDFQFIATTEVENYSKIIEKNGAFARLFRKIELTAASPEDTLAILEDRAITAQRKNKVGITFIALKQAVILAKKFIHDRVLPDSAISLLKEASSEPINGWITKEVIRKIVSERSKIPKIETGNLDKNKLLTLEDEIHKRLIDQEPAVSAIANALRRSVTGLREEQRPIGSFLFVGPTGVGKTELAKTLAAVYFETEQAYVRFDMSEYQNPESIVRLIGGQGEEGQLTEAVRRRPYALLLLDEFEKADRKILTLFLQVLDDGRLTDGAGRTVDFTNTIIIATSNVGSLLIAQGLNQGKSLESLDAAVNDEVLKAFQPELVNRFDEVVLFKTLSQADLEKIVRVKLAGLKNQMKEKGYLIEFSEELIAQAAKKGFDPALGARPLRRLIQDTLEANLSKLILTNKLIKGQAFKVGVELL